MERLSSLVLASSGVGGTLQAFEGLPALEKLYLRGTNLTGGFPASLPLQSPNLTDVDISETGVEGELPAELSQLRLLQSFEAENVPRLHGPVPLFDHSLKLEVLRITQAAVSGALPCFPSQALSVIDLSGNRISSLDEAEGGSMGNCYPNASVLRLHSNALTRLPKHVWRLPRLALLDVEYNNLLPWELGLPIQNASNSLEALMLSYNDFGRIDLGSVINDYLKDMVPSLSILSLAGCNIGGSVMSLGIASEYGCKRCISVDLSYNPTLTGDILGEVNVNSIVLEGLLASPFISKLQVQNTSVRLSHIVPLSNSLSVLDVEGTRVRVLDLDPVLRLQGLDTLNVKRLAATGGGAGGPDQAALEAVFEHVKDDEDATIFFSASRLFCPARRTRSTRGTILSSEDFLNRRGCHCATGGQEFWRPGGTVGGSGDGDEAVGEGACQPCPKNVNCSSAVHQANHTLPALSLYPVDVTTAKLVRSSAELVAETTLILACPTNGCNGASNGASDLAGFHFGCVPGRDSDSLLCSRCSIGFFTTVDGSCQLCHGASSHKDYGLDEASWHAFQTPALIANLGPLPLLILCFVAYIYRSLSFSDASPFAASRFLANDLKLSEADFPYWT